MAELLGSSRRSHYCTQLSINDIGKTVSVAGWAQRRRDLGSLIFIDLRDRSGIVQLAFDDATDKAVFDKAFTVRSEYVLFASGVVRERSSKNPNIPTGDIEIFVTELKILGLSETPPFDITDNTGAGEELRLKYRYLDLRRPCLMNNIMLRHKAAKITRDYFDENGFIEIETPILIKSTPEGARDYLVPSRLHKGSFYALPQSPQLYKQLSMVAGFDKYMQIARCFRDEDLRADRQPEFTQIDVEMSFVDVEDIFAVAEGYIKRLFKEALDVDIPTPLPRYTYRECMDRFGSDKPDMRFGMEIVDLTDIAAKSDFVVFKNAIEAGGSVRAINVKGYASTLTRKEIDKLAEYARGCGASGLAWIRHTDQGLTSSFSKFVGEELMAEICARTDTVEGDVTLIIANGNTDAALTQLGQLRLHVANRLNVPREGFSFLWVVEFPFFEYDKETGEFVAMHHPFTAPLDECLPYLETDKAKVRAKCYDMVLNGIELSSGSIRITDPDLQATIFRLLGLSEEAKAKFGYLLDAFRYGAPPHGGFAIGLDRIVMQMLGASSLRDVVAFPKVQNASELMTSCPAEVPEKALKELGITVLNQEEQNG